MRFQPYRIFCAATLIRGPISGQLIFIFERVLAPGRVDEIRTELVPDRGDKLPLRSCGKKGLALLAENGRNERTAL
jgi:hypothetical protein